MKTYEDILKEHGWRPGLWNDPFSQRFVPKENNNKNKSKNKK